MSGPSYIPDGYDDFELHRHSPESDLVLVCMRCGVRVYDFHVASAISVSVFIPLIDGHLATHHAGDFGVST